MSLPKKIKVGHRVYKIQRPTKAWGKKRDALGECDTDNHVIYVVRGLGPRQEINTFLHEAFHALYESHGLSFGKTGTEEERIVHTLTNALLDLFERNPELTDLIKEKLKDDSDGI